MAAKRKIEIFSAGCPVCTDTIEKVEALACPSCEVEVLDLQEHEVAERAIGFGIRSIPAILIDGGIKYSF